MVLIKYTACICFDNWWTISGQIHYIGPVVNKSTPKLFWRNSTMVWTLCLCFNSFQRMAIFGSSITCFCTSSYYKIKWNSNVGKSWIEEVGTFAWIPKLFENNFNSGAILEVGCFLLTNKKINFLMDNL